MSTNGRGRQASAPTDLSSGGLDALRRIAALPRWPARSSAAVRERLLAEEATLRDDLITYGYAMDAGDVDAVMEYFSDDVIISNPRGRYQGKEIVRKNYTYLFEQWSPTRHLWANVIVRFPEREDEAYRASYIYGLLSSPAKAFGAASSDVHRLRKVGGRWRIVERAITDDLSHSITVFGGPLEKKPEL